MTKSQRRERVRAGLRSLLNRVPVWTWMIICLAVAALYVVVWPRELAPSNPGSLHFIVLRWFHPLAWILLAASCAIRMSDLPARTRIANIIALMALPTYAAFFLAVVTATR